MTTTGETTPKENEPTDLRHDTMDFADTEPVEPVSPLDEVVNEEASITAVELDHLDNDAPGNMAAAYNTAAMDVAADPSNPGDEEEDAATDEQMEQERAADNEHHRK